MLFCTDPRWSSSAGVQNSTDALGPVRVTMNRMRSHTSHAAALIVLFASVGDAQTPATSDRQTADFSVQVFGYIVADFSARVDRYLELRRTLEDGLPPLTITDDPAEILRAENALARRIRVARDDAKQGEIFTPAIRAEFRRVLRLEMTADTLKDIMEENPGDFTRGINDTYSKEQVLSTMPANILALLPRLPDDIQYRFLGRHLVLHDTRANVILDRFPCALGCREAQ